MKEKDGFIDYPDQQIILYVEKEDGQYGPIQTGSYLSANFMNDFLHKRKNLEAGLRGQLIAGKISPVRFYMVMEDLTLQELSARSGIRQSRIKKHLDPVSFGKVTADELNHYASVFNIPAANLLQVTLIFTNDEFQSNVILENKAKNISVTQSATQNPYVVLTKIEERK
ncbi:MAG: hypothetical protein WC886_07265 [Saccharofermentanaceae bacterium]|jgi:hypothetical protein|nr:hypothetical protein [Bacteroidales bacterium]